MKPHMAMSNESFRKAKSLAFVNIAETLFNFCRSILEWEPLTQYWQVQISTPTTYPLDPAFSAAGKSDDPLPHPTSNTLAPG